MSHELLDAEPRYPVSMRAPAREDSDLGAIRDEPGFGELAGA